MKPGQLGNKMMCQHFTIFFVFMVRELKLWNFQRQLIFFHAVICILGITRNILHAIPRLLLCFPQWLTFRKKLSLSYDYDTPFSPTKDRCDTNFMLSLSLFFYRWLLQNETSLAICFLARGASFLVKIFYINLDPTGGPQLLCEFFLH